MRGVWRAEQALNL